jgi:hypothetical protein
VKDESKLDFISSINGYINKIDEKLKSNDFSLNIPEISNSINEFRNFLNDYVPSDSNNEIYAIFNKNIFYLIEALDTNKLRNSSIGVGLNVFDLEFYLRYSLYYKSIEDHFYSNIFDDIFKTHLKRILMSNCITTYYSREYFKNHYDGILNLLTEETLNIFINSIYFQPMPLNTNGFTLNSLYVFVNQNSMKLIHNLTDTQQKAVYII